MKLGSFDFRPTLIPTVVTILLLTLLLRLGFWQLGKAGTKVDMATRHAQRAVAPLVPASQLKGDPETLRYTRIIATGRYLSGQQFLLDNRTNETKAGYHVITPFELTTSGVILLVNRGWVPVGMDRAVLPEIPVPTAETQVRGELTVAVANAFLLGEPGYAATTWPRVVQRLDPAAAGEALKMTPLAPILRLDADEPNGFVRQWPAHWGITPDRHRGYAVQWFGLALALITIYIVVNTRRYRGTST
jgi:surfeit locus 1 family protein